MISSTASWVSDHLNPRDFQAEEERLTTRGFQSLPHGSGAGDLHRGQLHEDLRPRHPGGVQQHRQWEHALLDDWNTFNMQIRCSDAVMSGNSDATKYCEH